MIQRVCSADTHTNLLANITFSQRSQLMFFWHELHITAPLSERQTSAY